MVDFRGRPKSTNIEDRRNPRRRKPLDKMPIGNITTLDAFFESRDERQAAKRNNPIILAGESLTNKTRIARAKLSASTEARAKMNYSLPNVTANPFDELGGKSSWYMLQQLRGGDAAVSVRKLSLLSDTGETRRTLAPWLPSTALEGDIGEGAMAITPKLGSRSMSDADMRTLAYTLLGEAEGEGVTGMLAVANVINNRANSPFYPDDPISVALQPWQFSTNNPGEGGNQAGVRRRNPEGSDRLNAALQIVQSVFINQDAPDITGNSIYYHARSMTPSWADNVTTSLGTYDLGGHRFYPREAIGTSATDAISAVFGDAGTTAVPGFEEDAFQWIDGQFVMPGGLQEIAPTPATRQPATNGVGTRQTIREMRDEVRLQQMQAAAGVPQTAAPTSALPFLVGSGRAQFGDVMQAAMSVTPRLEDAGQLGRFTSVLPAGVSIADAMSDTGLGSLLGRKYPIRPIGKPAGESPIPPAARIFADTVLMGNRGDIDERSFSASELAIMERAVISAESDGRSYITYSDFTDGTVDPWGMGNSGFMDALTDQGKSLGFTLGSAQFKRDANGEITISDMYDFNASASDRDRALAENGGVPGLLIKGLMDNGLLGVGNVLGNLAVPEGEGRNVSIRIKGQPKSSGVGASTGRADQRNETRLQQLAVKAQPKRGDSPEVAAAKDRLRVSLSIIQDDNVLPTIKPKAPVLVDGRGTDATITEARKETRLQQMNGMVKAAPKPAPKAPVVVNGVGMSKTITDAKAETRLQQKTNTQRPAPVAPKSNGVGNDATIANQRAEQAATRAKPVVSRETKLNAFGYVADPIPIRLTPGDTRTPPAIGTLPLKPVPGLTLVRPKPLGTPAPLDTSFVPKSNQKPGQLLAGDEFGDIGKQFDEAFNGVPGDGQPKPKPTRTDAGNDPYTPPKPGEAQPIGDLIKTIDKSGINRLGKLNVEQYDRYATGRPGRRYPFIKMFLGIGQQTGSQVMSSLSTNGNQALVGTRGETYYVGSDGPTAIDMDLHGDVGASTSGASTPTDDRGQRFR